MNVFQTIRQEDTTKIKFLEDSDLYNLQYRTAGDSEVRLAYRVSVTIIKDGEDVFTLKNRYHKTALSKLD